MAVATGAVHRPATYADVKKAIQKLSTNKAPDCNGLTSEHLKFGADSILIYLTTLINVILRQGKIPPDLKKGILTPVYKKNQKNNPANYRGITVTSIIIKVLEMFHGYHKNPRLLQTQSKLQGGFTPGSSSVNTALILTEAVLEAKQQKKPLYVSFLDAEKAFDVVSHNSLLRKLYFDGLEGDSWLLLQDMYTDLTTSVKWEGLLSSSFEVNQGVRQGGILSSTHYKRYNNPLLLDLENQHEGARVGSISLPHATCADDIALMSHQEVELQAMLYDVESYTARERYNIQPTKSKILVFNQKQAGLDFDFKYENNSVAVDEAAVHLGITREDSSHIDLQSRIQRGRRTVYSLMGAGLHGRDGLSPHLSIKLWLGYVVPRVIFGLEALQILKTEMDALESFQRKMLKQLQFLPPRVATPAPYILLGAPPVEAIIHKRILALFTSIARSSDSTELALAYRQLSVKTPQDASWFVTVRKLLWKYQLPSVFSLLERPPSKQSWKTAVDKAVNSYWETTWRDEAACKSALKYINLGNIAIGRPHQIWSTVRNNRQDVHRASIKARLLTGTYTLQSNRAVFNQYTVDPTCRLCGVEPETREHFIAACPATEIERRKYRRRLEDILEFTAVTSFNRDHKLFTQLVLDSSVCMPELDKDRVGRVELLTREMIFRLHQTRSILLRDYVG